MNKKYTLARLAELTGSSFKGDPLTPISGVNTLEEASIEDVSFLSNPRYREAMKRSKAGVICIHVDDECPEGRSYLISQSPSRTFQTIVELMFQPVFSGFQGIHSTAIIHETAVLEEGVIVAPYAVIDRDVRIGKHTFIGAHVSIGANVEIGEDCTLQAGVTIGERCILKSRVYLQPGVVIGSCGFGFLLTPQGTYQKIEQLGIVLLENDVEIGANTTIDRSRFKMTIVREGSKIDNLCQIAHNVEIGPHNVIAAQTGIAGSSKTGRHVVLGGQVGIVGHIELADEVMVASRGGISKSLKSGKYRGSPVLPIDQYQENEIHLRRIKTYVQRIKTLEDKVEKLTQLLSNQTGLPN